MAKEKVPMFISSQGHIRDRIIIHESAKIPREGLFLSLNGFAFLVKPGVEIDLPRPVREMLDTRIETETFQDDQGESHVRNIPRITYTKIKDGVNLLPSGEIDPDYKIKEVRAKEAAARETAAQEG